MAGRDLAVTVPMIARPGTAPVSGNRKHTGVTAAEMHTLHGASGSKPRQDDLTHWQTAHQLTGSQAVRFWA